MENDDDFELDSAQLAVLQRINERRSHLSALAEVFSDPADAFVFAPTQLRIGDLVSMYLHLVEPDVAAELPSRLRRRCRDERWIERRAIVQAKRMSSRREALIAAEAEVWAMVGVEFTQMRLRSMWERYQLLEEYVSGQLMAIAGGDGAFTTFIRDACKELSELEARMSELVPSPDVKSRGTEIWTKRASDRTAIIARIEDRLKTAMGGDRAAHVFEVIDGGKDEDGDKVE